MRCECIDTGNEMVIDSAGIGDWHVGQPPDPRAVAVAANHGVAIDQLRAKQVTIADFTVFDHIIALDRQVLRDLQAMAPNGSHAQLSLLLDFVPGRDGEDVDDPYYGPEDGFERAWADIDMAVRALCVFIVKHALAKE